MAEYASASGDDSNGGDGGGGGVSCVLMTNLFKVLPVFGFSSNESVHTSQPRTNHNNSWINWQTLNKTLCFRSFIQSQQQFMQ